MNVAHLGLCLRPAAQSGARHLLRLSSPTRATLLSTSSTRQTLVASRRWASSSQAIISEERAASWSWKQSWDGATGARASRRTYQGAASAAILGLTAFSGFRYLSNTDKSSDESFVDPLPPTNNYIASSPHEPREPVTSRLIGFLRDYIWEPISTFFRFIHLALLFGPVILTAPMLLVGSPSGRVRENGVWKRQSPRQQARSQETTTRRSAFDDDERTDKASVVKTVVRVDPEEERWGALWWYGFLVKQMERAGPTFIKLGQWAASRADLFPAALCDMMGKLHSNGQPHAFRHTRRVIEDVFGRPLDELFEKFDQEPIGCGAIAQVYIATMKAEFLPDSFLEARKGLPKTAAAATNAEPAKVNTAVAIKVVHPRVEKTIQRDLAIMSLFARALNLLPGMEWLSLPEEVGVFGDMMNSQLDLRVEANNLDRFQENFKHRGPGVTFPRPVRVDKSRMSNGSGRHEDALRNAKAESKLLIEEYEDALPLKYFLRNGGGQYDDRIANIGLDAFLNMLLLDNWTHGDLHPGNIMVRFYKPSTSDFLQHLASKLFSTPEPADPIFSDDSTRIVQDLRSVSKDSKRWREKLDDLADQGYEPELIFIDAGLVTSLDTNNRRNFLDLFQAVAEFDGYRAGQLMVERCRTPELAIDKETFALKMQHLVLSVKSKTFSLAAIKISDVLTEVLQAVRTHHVKMEGDFVNTVISILLLEGIGRQLDPNMDLFKSALPILRQLGRKMGTKDAIAQVPKGNILAMAKIWVWLEAREIAGSSSVANIDEWIKLDRLTPNI